MKKVLSLVLVLTLVLGSFSMAFAAETTETNLSDIAGDANEGAIVVANDLGIVTGYPDGTFKPDNAVTRAEFAAMMTRALAVPESALKGFKTAAFKDVATDHWAVAYLGYCNSKGIMTGYEDGTARPNQTITVNEAMTMVCRALGYTNQAKELVGSWPANYIALGQQLGLYGDVEAVATTDRASAAQIIYNALTVPVKYIDADGVTRNLTDGAGNFVTMLGNNGGSEANNGYAFVLDSTAAEAAVINVNAYVGQYVKAFLDDDLAIIAIEVLSETITGDYNLAKGIISTDDVDYYFDQTNNYDYTWDDGNGPYNPAPMYVVNGKTETVTPLPGINDEDTVTLAVKINGKTITEVYSYIDWTVAATDMFEDGDLNVEKAKINVNGTDYKFKTDKNGDIDMNSFALLGVSSLDKIAEDNVVQVSVSSGLITKLAVGTKTVKGEVTESNKGASKFTIDGTKYALDDDFADAIAVGDTGTAYLTYAGDIAFWDVDDATAGNYGVFLAGRVDSGTTIASGVTMVGIVLKDGTVKELETTSSTKYVNMAGTEWTGTPTGTAVAATDFANGTIVTYSIDSKGKLSKIVEAGTTGVVGNVNEGKTRIANTKFASNIIVFQEDNDGDWTIGSVKNFSTDFGFTLGNCVIATNTKGEIEAIAVDKEDVLGSEDSFGLITSVVKKNNDGTATWYVKGFLDGKAFEGFTNDTGAANTIPWINSTCGGAGLYKITVDADGTVSGVVKAPTVSAKAVALGAPVENAAVTGDTNTYLIVKSVDKTLKEITVSGGAVYGLTDNVAVYKYDLDEDEYTVSSIDKIGKGAHINFVATGKSAWDDELFNVVIYWTE